MATALTPVTPKGPYPVLPVTADSLDFALAAADVAGNYFTPSGKDLLIAQNSGASAYTLTISSVADTLGRTGDITSYSIGNGEFMAFYFGATAGWQQSNGNINVTANNAAVKLAVIRIPS